MRWPEAGELLGLGFEHGAEVVAAPCALLLRVLPVFVQRVWWERFAEKGAVMFESIGRR